MSFLKKVFHKRKTFPEKRATNVEQNQQKNNEEQNFQIIDKTPPELMNLLDQILQSEGQVKKEKKKEKEQEQEQEQEKEKEQEQEEEEEEEEENYFRLVDMIHSNYIEKSASLKNCVCFQPICEILTKFFVNQFKNHQSTIQYLVKEHNQKKLLQALISLSRSSDSFEKFQNKKLLKTLITILSLFKFEKTKSKKETQKVFRQVKKKKKKEQEQEQEQRKKKNKNKKKEERRERRKQY
ncbi:protein eiger [Anaeramoeba flamelloides]|uniref:Protein eiger n=1 Tax=Anaeramoeba flamelloides TaxID=1746091 RepID=A0ABQ8XC08_9EUKA|nr:protein eiger [Anaeramoeba flamelloides]